MNPEERELARLISGAKQVPGNEHGAMDLARGEVVQLTGNVGGMALVAGFVGVKIDASTTTVACEFLNSYQPTQGDIVEILALGDRAVIIGKIGTVGGGRREHRGWAISGTLLLAAGAANFIPPIFVTNPTGGTSTLIAMVGKLRAGTADVEVKQYSFGGTLKSTSTITLGSSPSSNTSLNVKVASFDYFGMDYSSAPTAADGLALTLVFEQFS